MKWAKQTINIHLICMLTLVGLVFLMGCPEIKVADPDDNPRSNVDDVQDDTESLSKQFDSVSKSTVVAADSVSTSAEALLTGYTSERTLKSLADTLYENTKTMRDEAQKTKDAAEKVVKSIEADEAKALSSGGSAFIVSKAVARKESARLRAAKAVFNAAKKALEKAKDAYEAAKKVRDDAKNNEKVNNNKIREVIKTVKQFKTLVQSIQVVHKSVKEVKAETTTETIVLISEQAGMTGDAYEASMEVGEEAQFILEDAGVGTGALSAVYKADGSTGTGDKFTVTSSGRTITFTPQSGANAPTAGTYIYTIRKAKTGENTKATDVTITITVTAQQETIVLDEGFVKMEVDATANIVVTDSGVGTGTLSALYKAEGSTGTGDKFTVTADAVARTITFTPKEDGNAPTVGTYIYTIRKAKTGGNTEATEAIVVIEVVAEIPAKEETIVLDNPTPSMTQGDTEPLVVADNGVGTGDLSAVYKSAGSAGDKFTVTARGRTITFTPKEDDNAPGAGTYIYTIRKTKTGKNTEAENVDVTITVVQQETIVLDNSTPSMTVGATAPIVVSDNGVGTGVLSAVYKAEGSTGDKFDITVSGQTITFTPKAGGDAPTAGTYIYTISKVKTGENIQAESVDVTITVQRFVARDRFEVMDGGSVTMTHAEAQLFTEDNKETKHIIFIDVRRGENGSLGTGILSVTKVTKDGNSTDVKDTYFELKSYNKPFVNTIRITGKQTAPLAAGTYVFTISDGKGFTLIVDASPRPTFNLSVDVLGASGTVTGSFNATMTEAEAQNFTSTNANTKKIVLTDTGAGTGALSVTQVMKKGGDVLSTYFDVASSGTDNRTLTITGKRTAPLPSGTYVFTIEKAQTANHVKATLEFTLHVEFTPSTFSLASSGKGVAELEGNTGISGPFSATMTGAETEAFTSKDSNASIVFTDTGTGEGALSVTKVTRDNGGDVKNLYFDVPDVDSSGAGSRTLTIKRVQGKAPFGNTSVVQLAAGTYVFTIEKAQTTSHEKATLEFTLVVETLLPSTMSLSGARSRGFANIQSMTNIAETAHTFSLIMTLAESNEFTEANANANKIVLTDSGEGTGALSVTEALEYYPHYSNPQLVERSEPLINHFKIDISGRELTITAKSDFRKRSEYIFTLEKAATATHRRTMRTFILNMKLPPSTISLSGEETRGVADIQSKRGQTGNFSATMTKAEAQAFTSDNQFINQIVFRDTGTGDGFLRVTKVIKDKESWSDHFDITQDQDPFYIRARKNEALEAGTYVFTIVKRRTRDHGEAWLEFTLIVQ